MAFSPPEACIAIRRVGPAAALGASTTPAEGEVVAIGPGAEFRPPEVKLGDRVFFDSETGVDVRSDGETLVVMKEADLLCVIAKTAARSAP